jgi:hypothetical protein
MIRLYSFLIKVITGRSWPATLLVLPAIVLLLCNSHSYGQPKQAHELRLQERAQHHFAEFAQSIGPAESGMYMVILQPMGCPRCEGLINPLFQRLRIADPMAKLVTALVYPDIPALGHYIANRDFHHDTLVALPDSVNRWFWLRSKTLKVPFLLKISALGELQHAVSLLGMHVNDSLIHEISSLHTSLPMKQTAVQQAQIVPIDELELAVESIKHLRSPPDFPLSFVIDLSTDKRGELVALTDQLSLQCRIYSLQTGTLLESIEPDDAARKAFIPTELPDAIYRYMMSTNILNTMYFRTAIFDEGTYTIGSLPKLVLESDSAVGYYNQVALIKKTALHGTQVVPLEDLPHNAYVLEHTRSHFDLPHGRIIIPISKGWPSVAGGLVLDSNDSLGNPFLPAFYDETALVAIYDTAGKFQSLAGELELFHQRSKVGYAFARPVVSSDSSDLWVSSGCGGTIYKMQSSLDWAISDSIRLWQDPDVPSAEGAVEDPLDHMALLRSSFDRMLLDFKVEDDLVRGISRQQGARYYFEHRVEGGSDSWLIPSIINGRKLHECRLATGNSSAVLAVYGYGSETMLVSLVIPAISK